MSDCINCQVVLTIKEVSALLQCSQDTIRRTPRDQLPAYRVGKVNLYLHDDVIAYVKSRQVQSTCANVVREHFPRPPRLPK